jgi:hypothetical protein
MNTFIASGAYLAPLWFAVGIICGALGLHLGTKSNKAAIVTLTVLLGLAGISWIHSAARFKGWASPGKPEKFLDIDGVSQELIFKKPLHSDGTNSPIKTLLGISAPDKQVHVIEVNGIVTTDTPFDNDDGTDIVVTKGGTVELRTHHRPPTKTSTNE